MISINGEIIQLIVLQFPLTDRGIIESASSELLKNGTIHVGRVRCVEMSPSQTCVQYIGGCLVHRGCSVHRGDIMSTSAGVPYIEEITMSTSGGYHEYIRGIS